MENFRNEHTLTNQAQSTLENGLEVFGTDQEKCNGLTVLDLRVNGIMVSFVDKESFFMLKEKFSRVFGTIIKRMVLAFTGAPKMEYTRESG